MSKTTLDTLIDQWVRDPLFRTALARDPHAAAREAGLALNDTELDLLSRSAACRSGRSLPIWQLMVGSIAHVPSSTPELY
jgi:hypothetical protein